MSEHAERAPVPFFGDGTAVVATPHEVGSPAVHDGADWPVAVVFLGSIAVSYAVVVVAIYLALAALI